ncbi:MAG: N-methylglutamate dehydrogenase subunit C, partial [bacterium]
LMRVGFVGELGYEIHAPAADTPRLWDALFREGQAAGIQAFGVEAQRLLRLEKGHVILGQDTDGLTTPVEASLEWAVRMDKPFFIGQRSLQAMAGRPPRHRLVGFLLDAADAEHAPSECHLVIHRGEIGGRVTSIAHSRTLNQVIGLAYVPPALSTPGSRLEIRSEGGRMVRAEVVKTPFYDPEGRRQKVGEHAAEDSA